MVHTNMGPILEPRQDTDGLDGTFVALLAPALVLVGLGNAAFEFEGVDGESQAIDHVDWINLLSFKQGLYIPASSIGAAGDRASSVFEEIALKKKLDKASLRLAAAVSQGEVFPKVDIHITRALSDGTRVTYYSCELTNALLTSYRVRGAARDNGPIEDISLNFEQITVTYTKFDDSGRLESIVEYGWDVVRNQAR